MSDQTHPDSPSGQPYSAPRKAWGGNADPRNLSYDGARHFGPGYEQDELPDPDGSNVLSIPAGPWSGEGEEVLGEEARIQRELFKESVRWELLHSGAVGISHGVDALVDRIASNPHLAALVAEARGTFAAADSEQDRLAGWVLANCPGEPSQDGGVVDTVIRLITSARADGARLLRVYHREPMSQDCRDGRHFGECWGCDCICHGPGGSS